MTDVLDPMSEGRVIGFWRKLTEREVCYKCPLLFHVLATLPDTAASEDSRHQSNPSSSLSQHHQMAPVSYQ
ncbi:hypothetical protein VKT23_020594 [Stygiomarasmius scandens]|uniref:Uncharacterized protein n=1 Tax=Marasmiellus scandens TaxID=2682957 RepID=A0ABR1IIR7_9AGAR